MPHVVVLYTSNLDTPATRPGDAGMRRLCRSLADAVLSVRDEAGKPVFPTGGVRVFAYPAPHFAVADDPVDGGQGHAFVYVNLRMGRGRSEGVKKSAGDALTTAARKHFEHALETRGVGLTIQVDEGAEVYDAKVGSLHARYGKG